MTPPGSQDRRATFVVRAVQDGRGEVHGVIERVSTGAKETFTGVEAMGRVIAGMLAREEARFSADPRQKGTSDNDASEP